MIIAMVSSPAYNKTFKADRCISAHLHFDRNPRTVQKRAKVTAVLAVVTIKHELLKFPENLLGSHSVAP